MTPRDLQPIDTLIGVAVLAAVFLILRLLFPPKPRPPEESETTNDDTGGL
jgi:hypothetical protein